MSPAALIIQLRSVQALYGLLESLLELVGENYTTLLYLADQYCFPDLSKFQIFHFLLLNHLS